MLPSARCKMQTALRPSDGNMIYWLPRIRRARDLLALWDRCPSRLRLCQQGWRRQCRTGRPASFDGAPAHITVPSHRMSLLPDATLVELSCYATASGKQGMMADGLAGGLRWPRSSRFETSLSTFEKSMNACGPASSTTALLRNDTGLT